MPKLLESSPPSLSLALSFLTAIPVRTGAPQAGDLGRAAVWFPLVGFALGVVLSVAYWLLAQMFPPYLAAALIVALWAALTGGLHLDGLADCGDGLLCVAPVERRLEIMRDPRLGSFGVISLLLFLLLKVLAVAALSPIGLWQGLLPVGALVVAPTCARWLLLIATRQPAARPGGMGQDFAAGLTSRTLLMAALAPLSLVVLAGPLGWLAALLAAAVAGLAIGLARARLHGVTGDVFGLVVELAELTILLTYAALPAAHL